MNNTLIENIDYYIDDNGKFVFTESYHLNRGFCCSNDCKHCPYRAKAESEKVNEK